MDYIVEVRDYVSVIVSTLLVISIVALLPQSLERIRSRARKELSEMRYHRCYAADNLTSKCCCETEQRSEQVDETDDDEDEVEQDEDEGEVFVEDEKKMDLVELINQLETKTTTIAPAIVSVNRVQEDLEHLQPVHVSQIAKKFENGDDGEKVKRNKVFRRRPSSEYSDNNHIIAARQSVNRRPISEYFESTKLTKVDDVDDESSENNQVNGIKRKPISEYFQPKVIPKDNDEVEVISVVKRNRSNGPVTSIEEILAQKRLSRPLSAYSITDLLGDSLPDDVYVENFFNNLV